MGQKQLDHLKTCKICVYPHVSGCFENLLKLTLKKVIGKIFIIFFVRAMQPLDHPCCVVY